MGVFLWEYDPATSHQGVPSIVPSYRRRGTGTRGGTFANYSVIEAGSWETNAALPLAITDDALSRCNGPESEAMLPADDACLGLEDCSLILSVSRFLDHHWFTKLTNLNNLGWKHLNLQLSHVNTISS